MSCRAGRRPNSRRHDATEGIKAMTKLTSSKIRPCLWFDTQGEEAANFYVSIFDNSSITSVTRRGETAPGEAGTVLTVVFELEGQEIVALNGGPDFRFNEAISFQVDCETQAEVDRLWKALSEGGEEGPCGWLKDRFGLSWQIVPTVLPTLLSDPDQGRVLRRRLHGRRRLLDPPAGRRRRRHLAVQLPGDGPDVVLPDRHRLRQHGRAEAEREGPVRGDVAGRAVGGSRASCRRLQRPAR